MASSEQAQGIDQIAVAMSEIDKITQQNAVAAEDMAASMSTYKVKETSSEVQPIELLPYDTNKFKTRN